MRKVLLSFLLVMGSLILVAQNTVSGNITDSESNEALIGATVLVKGTNNGTITDVNGAFSLQDVPPGTYTLQVWHETLGQQTQDITVNANAESSPIVEFTP